MGRKRKKRKIKKPKLPQNKSYWLAVIKNKKDIEAFAQRGNDRQKKELKKVIQYKLWQIQQGEENSKYFSNLGVDLKTIELDIKNKRGMTSKKKQKKETPKIIDLFDIKNIKELTK